MPKPPAPRAVAWAALYLGCAFAAYLCLERGWLPHFIAATTLVAAMLGVFMSASPPWLEKNRTWVVWAFAILGVAGLWATVQQVNAAEEKSAADTKSQRESARELSAAIGDLSRVTQQALVKGEQDLQIGKQTIDLQRRLLGTADEIKTLSVDAINTGTGGDSFCYMEFAHNVGSTQGLRIIVSVGKYPLTDVSVSVFEMGSLDVLNPKERFHFATLAKEQPYHLGMTHIGESGKVDYNIHFSAKNGLWYENLRVRRVGDSWAHSIKVTRGRTVLYERTDEEFPSDEK